MRPLTKSRFKLALECPTKLYYLNNAAYEDKSQEDSFMEALAEGGYQVGELAKMYYPGGHDITESGYDGPLEQTNELLKQENVIIYEAAVLYKNLFIRVDILEKKGNTIHLIEVKAKSFDGHGTDSFIHKKGYVQPEWSAYLQDVAFQKYVTQKAFPSYVVKAYLMLADKSKTASVNGLNQHFQITKSPKGRKSVTVHPNISLASLGTQILTAIDVNAIAQLFIDDKAGKGPPSTSYAQKIEEWSEAYHKEEKIVSAVGVHCFGCQFKGNNLTKKSGFHECWKQQYSKLTDTDLAKPMVHAIWDNRRKKKHLEEGVLFVEDLTEIHISDSIQPTADGKLSRQERQWMQVEKIQKNDDTFYLDRDRLREQMNSFTYPLHFIDFETSMVAIPFYIGQKPYEQVAFQFSHHIMYQDGTVQHKTEFIETTKGAFPNFNFVRALREALNEDEGTIFRFAAHENTVLNQILRQLEQVEDTAVSDRQELMDFILTVTEVSDGRIGSRTMVDMCRMVKNYYFDPRTGGSNSIKAVLPAVLSRSQYIQTAYARPTYGSATGITSKNFKNKQWLVMDDEGKVKSPYKLLPPIFESVDEDSKADFISDTHLADGGAAMVAFAKIQFTSMSETEHNLVIKGLLKYCELDTLAMVMIYQFWMEETVVL